MESAFRENGGLRVVVEHSRRWQRLGAAVEWFVLQQVPDEAAELASQTPHRYGARGGRLRLAAPLIFARLLLAARRADVLVSVSEAGNGLLFGAAAAKLLRKPLAACVHTPLERSIQAWTPRPLHGLTYAAVRGTDALVCVARALVSNLEARGVPRQRIHVIENGVDVERVRRRGAEPIEPPLPAADGTPLVVSVGRLSAQKGFDVLIEAHARALRAGLPHRLAILGEGPERPALEAQIERLGVGETVQLLGFRTNPHAIMARADLLCMASRYEGYPLVLIEALALGVPMIATDCATGPAEVLAGGRYGDLVAVDDVAALASALCAHLREPARLRQLARHGPERARQFDPDTNARRFLDVLAQLAHHA
ncbi:MAG TPA: glycosyltransferase [Polyangiales bacterium]|nr:glycosyltransferase [Polyangiales bacterium]